MAKMTTVEAPGKRVFHLKECRCAADMPSEALEQIRSTFSHLRFGEIPDSRGNVNVSVETPRDRWHPEVTRILGQYDGLPVS